MASRKKRFALGIAALVVVDLLIGGAIISVVKSADFAPGGGEGIEKNVITTVPIRDNMFLIRGGVANVTVLIEDEGVVIGDMFVHSGLPYISEKYGAAIDGYLAGQSALMGHIGEKTIIIPGHGPIADRQDLVETSEALHIVRNRIAALKAKGLSGRDTWLLFPARNTWGF